MSNFKSWGYMRWIRLVFGVFSIANAILTKDITLGLLGIVVGGMALFNIGCCGTNGCDTNYKKENNDNNKISDVEFEEVVAK